MKAVRVHEWSSPPLLEEVDDPSRLDGHTLVRMEAATVGHLDRTIWAGGFLRHPPLPYTPGVEGSGVVVDSDIFATGERVWLRGGGLGTATDGTWSELVSAPSHIVGLLPDNVPFDLGSVFFSPCTSAWVSLHDVADVQPGATVLVSGANGAVGSVTVQLALGMGAHVIGAVSSAEAAAELPDDVTPLVTTDPLEPDAIQADVLIDPVGGEVLNTLLPLVRPGGRAVLVGYVGGASLTLTLPVFVQRDVSLLPLNMINREQQGRDAVPELLARLGDGRLQMPVTRFGFDDSAAALDWLVQRGHRGRAALVKEM